MRDLNLNDERNQEMIKLISDEDIETIEEELEFKIFKLTKRLKQKKITKLSANLPKSVSPKPANQAKPVQAPKPQSDVKIKFYDYNLSPGNFPHIFTFSINTSTSVDQLIEQLEKKRRVS